MLDFLPFTGHLALLCPALYWALGREQGQAPGSGGFRAGCNCLPSPLCSTVPDKRGKLQSQGDSPGLHCGLPHLEAFTMQVPPLAVTFLQCTHAHPGARTPLQVPILTLGSFLWATMTLLHLPGVEVAQASVCPVGLGALWGQSLRLFSFCVSSDDRHAVDATQVRLCVPSKLGLHCIAPPPLLPEGPPPLEAWILEGLSEQLSRCGQGAMGRASGPWVSIPS